MKYFKKLGLFVFIASLVLILFGCADASIVVNVADDNSGNVQIVIGMDQRLLAMARSQGEDPFADIDSMTTQGWVKAEEWVESNMQWLRLERSFNDLDELRGIFLNMPMLSEIAIDQDGRDISFVGTVQPMNNEQPSNSEMESMTAGMINFRLNVRLPGELVETNGVFNRDENAYSWQLDPFRSTDVAFTTRISLIDYIRNDWGLLLAVVTGGLLIILSVVIALIYIGFRRRQQPARYSDFQLS
jgi:hypothetical protein